MTEQFDHGDTSDHDDTNHLEAGGTDDLAPDESPEIGLDPGDVEGEGAPEETHEEPYSDNEAAQAEMPPNPYVLSAAEAERLAADESVEPGVAKNPDVVYTARPDDDRQLVNVNESAGMIIGPHQEAVAITGFNGDSAVVLAYATLQDGTRYGYISNLENEANVPVEGTSQYLLSHQLGEFVEEVQSASAMPHHAQVVLLYPQSMRDDPDFGVRTGIPMDRWHPVTQAMEPVIYAKLTLGADVQVGTYQPAEGGHTLAIGMDDDGTGVYYDGKAIIKRHSPPAH